MTSLGSRLAVIAGVFLGVVTVGVGPVPGRISATRARVTVDCIAGYIPAADRSSRCVPSTTITVSPHRGPAGTTITVKGAACPQAGWAHETWHVHVGTGLAGTTPAPAKATPPSGDPKTPIAFTDSLYPGKVEADVTPRPDGRWVARFVLPKTVALGIPTTPGRYPIGALCYAAEGAEAGLVNYTAGSFVVTGR